ncbi:unnamed protein product [Ixodes hexagonus]
MGRAYPQPASRREPTTSEPSESRKFPSEEADPAEDQTRQNHRCPESGPGDANEPDEGSKVQQAFVRDVRVKTEPVSADETDATCETEKTDHEAPAYKSPVHKGVEKQCQTVFDFVEYKKKVCETTTHLKMEVLRLQRNLAKAHEENGQVRAQLEQYERDALVRAALRLREERGENRAACFLKHQLLHFGKEGAVSGGHLEGVCVIQGKAQACENEKPA